ncbi:MerR family transcriptional regulator [Crossiella sp. SN42]|uniref:MerR family transcriptional regulator n=1 Tax=Crossiella sp. SN42 TaxID=2944808 RepID=UPI00207D2E9B|nr:MerR family transcriptional regulator [Crossiella sp. SN42]MCO1575657.1 MerR family transcriptional regulator [Crossiella sp. SN42]
MDYSIGELAGRTGLTVKAIRFYADQGLVPSARDQAGHRRFTPAALARLDLIRTLRALDLPLPVIRRVLDRELTLPEVAAAHAEALATQIRALTLRQAVLRVATTVPELDLLHRLATSTEAERLRLVEDFLDAVFTRRGGISQSLTPELPPQPTTAQLEAWLELAALTQDPDFRALLRNLADQQAAGLPSRTSPPRSATGSPPHWPKAWTRPRPRPAQWPKPSSRSTPTSRTCSPASVPPPTRAATATCACWPPSTAGPRPNPSRPRWTGRSGRCGLLRTTLAISRPGEEPTMAEFGQDPEDASTRPASEVQGYLQ